MALVPAPCPGWHSDSCLSLGEAEPFCSPLSFSISATVNIRNNFTGVSDQRFSATISAEVSVNPWRVCQKLLYLYFPRQCLNFLSKLHCWYLSTPILSLLTVPPYLPQTPIILTSPIITLFFSLPHSRTQCRFHVSRLLPLPPTQHPTCSWGHWR